MVEAARERDRTRLKRYGCDVSDIVDRGILRSIYFTDLMGIALEASCWTIDLDNGSFEDAVPVPGSRSRSGARRVADHRRDRTDTTDVAASTRSCASRAPPETDRRTARTRPRQLPAADTGRLSGLDQTLRVKWGRRPF